MRRLTNPALALAIALSSPACLAGNITAGGPLLDGLTHKQRDVEQGNVSAQVHSWVGQGSHFMLRSLSITQQDTEFNGTIELTKRELGEMARAMARTEAEGSSADRSMDGPYGNFRVRRFLGSSHRHCVALRSFDGINRPNDDMYDSFDGDARAMGTERVDGVYCRVAVPLTDAELSGLINSIR